MKQIPLSVVIITKNSGDILSRCLKGVSLIAKEIIIIDDYSTDDTLSIAAQFKSRIFSRHNDDFGMQRAYGLKKATQPWILQIDSDEVIIPKLANEIKQLLQKKPLHPVYYLPFQNHYLGRPIHYGGENYLMPRLFRKSAVRFKPTLVHERATLIKKGSYGILQSKLYHYSYRNIFQMYKKFTDYALREARQKKQAGEKTSFKKIFLYAPHMFWARFIKDKGYKDGLFRIPLDLGFAYMEFITYVALPIV